VREQCTLMLIALLVSVLQCVAVCCSVLCGYRTQVVEVKVRS